MFPNKIKEESLVVHGIPYRKQVLVADVNIPYKFSLDRLSDTLFFCINADEFCDQSFQSVVLELKTNRTHIVPSIRNGFASAVDHTSGHVYLGGSNGIFLYNHETRNIEKPALIPGMDIFDMYFSDCLYYVDTATQNLFTYKNKEINICPELKDHLIIHFVIDKAGDIFFVNDDGLQYLGKDDTSIVRFEHEFINFRGATTDVYGEAHFIAEDGIYNADKVHKEVNKIASLENGYGLAFDRYNNIVYSEERSIIKLIRNGNRRLR